MRDNGNLSTMMENSSKSYRLRPDIHSVHSFEFLMSKYIPRVWPSLCDIASLLTWVGFRHFWVFAVWVFQKWDISFLIYDLEYCVSQIFDELGVHYLRECTSVSCPNPKVYVVQALIMETKPTYFISPCLFFMWLSRIAYINLWLSYFFKNIKILKILLMF